MQLKYVWRRMGGHIHVSVFQGKGEGFTWGKNGELVFDEAGWAAFSDRTTHRVIQEAV